MSRFRLSPRDDIDGWALLIKGADEPMMSSLCTTRREARAERDHWRKQGLLRGVTLLVVPVHVRLEVVGARRRRGRSNATRALPLGRDIA